MTIEYPVDVENTRWTIYHMGEERVLDQHCRWPVVDGGPIEGLDSNWIYLREIYEDRPTVDLRVQLLVSDNVLDLEASTHTFRWKVAPSISDPVAYLAHVKRIKKVDVNIERDRVEQAGFTFNGKRFDSDKDSAIRIANAATVAVASPEAFSVNWTTEDNSVMVLNAGAMLQMQGALMLHADSCHATARMHKEAIDALMVAQDVLEYDYSGGWSV